MMIRPACPRLWGNWCFRWWIVRSRLNCPVLNIVLAPGRHANTCDQCADDIKWLAGWRTSLTGVARPCLFLFGSVYPWLDLGIVSTQSHIIETTGGGGGGSIWQQSHVAETAGGGVGYHYGHYHSTESTQKQLGNIIIAAQAFMEFRSLSLSVPAYTQMFPTRIERHRHDLFKQYDTD